MSYKQLQSALKEYRNQGIELQVRLNASKEVLQAEFERIEALLAAVEAEREPQEIEYLAEEPVLDGDFDEPISEQLPVTSEQLPSVPTVVKQPIFHRKRPGLLNSIVHLAQCTAIMVNRMVDNHPPRVPVVRMPGNYQRAWA